jgi:hypothetical protein
MLGRPDEERAMELWICPCSAMNAVSHQQCQACRARRSRETATEG